MVATIHKGTQRELQRLAWFTKRLVIGLHMRKQQALSTRVLECNQFLRDIA
jgi:hypothetical protein